MSRRLALFFNLQKTWLNAVPSLHTHRRLNAKAQQYLPQDMFRASLTQPGLLWSNSFLEYTHVSAAFSNNARQKSCSLKLSLFPPPQISVGSNSGSLWRVISERAHWFGGWGKVMYGLTGEREREREGKGARAVMYVCMYLAVDLEAQRTPPKHPPISSAGTDGAQQARHLSALLCVFCSGSKRVMAS